MKIPVDELSRAIEQELNSYQKSTVETVRDTVDSVAEEAVQKLKLTSPKKSGAYGRGWKSTVTSDIPTGLVKKIHNRKAGLTHLLEKGHAKVGGGRVDGQPHIAPVEKEVSEQLQANLEKAL